MFIILGIYRRKYHEKHRNNLEKTLVKFKDMNYFVLSVVRCKDYHGNIHA